MSSFDERMQLTEIIESNLSGLFSNAIVKKFGCKVIIGNNEDLQEYIKQPEINQEASGMIVKFAPDFILLKNTAPKALFFLDIKHSVSPIWASSRLKLLREQSKDYSISISDIGVVAREALLSYRRFFPSTIILMASPYNSQLFMAQFADRVKCIYCYRSKNKENYCNACPAENNSFFDIERSVDSLGSQTPHTNIDLRSFEPVVPFFANLGININKDTLSGICEYIKKENIDFRSLNSNKYPERENTIRWQLNQKGCNWINYKVYSTENTGYYHLSKACGFLQNREIIEFPSCEAAVLAGKRMPCRQCFKMD